MSVLFCPFCRESFEGKKRCPDDDLPLVAWDALPARPEAELGDDEEARLTDLRRGRAELLLGGALLLASSMAPFVEIAGDGRVQRFSTLSAASTAAPGLWSVPFAGALFLSLVLRRRTPRQMRGARLAALFVALVPVATAMYSAFRIDANSVGQFVDVSFLWGGALIAVGSLLAFIGGLRFGGRPPREHAQPPSSPDTGLTPS
jgi:hypothetical protein